jgi:hypothetical protein
MPLKKHPGLFLSFVFLLQSFLGFSQQGFHEGLKAEKSGTLWGFKNARGKWIIPAQYDTVYHAMEFGKAIVGKNRRCGVINLKGEIVIPFLYDAILPEYKNLFPIKNEKGKWGFVHLDGKVVFPMKYDNFRYEYRDPHLLLQEKGKWGIYTPAALEIIKPTYKQIFYVQGKTYKTLPFASNDILSSSGNLLSTIEGDDIRILSPTTFAYSIIGKKGICTAHQKLCDPKFDEVMHAHDSLYFAQTDGAWNLVFSNGNMAYKNTWTALDVEKDYFVGHVNAEEQQLYTWPFKIVSSDTYRDIVRCTNKTWLVKNRFNLWGSINEQGEQLISFRYDSIAPFDKGIAQAKLQGETVIINETGDVIITAAEYPNYTSGLLRLNQHLQKEWMEAYQTHEDIVQLSYHYYRIQHKNKRYGIIDSKGKFILPCHFDALHLSSDNLTFIARQGAKYLLYDPQAKLISGPHKRFDEVIDVSEGLIKVKYKGALGFCDLEGRIMISTQYEETGLFKNGICPVKLRGRWGYIDKEEKLMVQPYYQAPAVFYGEAGIIKENDMYHLINTKGKITLEYPLTSIVRTVDGLYLIENTQGLWGLANASGKEVIAAKYKSITRCDNGLFIVSDDTYSGVMDHTGKILIPIKYNRLSYHHASKQFCGVVNKDWVMLTIK